MQICLVLLHGVYGQHVYKLSEFLAMASESHKEKYGKCTDMCAGSRVVSDEGTALIIRKIMRCI